jgi:hypothetical protein
LPDPLKRDPGQILVPLYTPKAQPFKAGGEAPKAGLELDGNTWTRIALRLLDHACTVTEQDDIALTCGKRHFERMDQGEPFGVSA